ncbi:MAG: response regulator [Elusimicrobiota bacterium]
MENKKILVVDDEPDILKFVRILLEKNGYSVITAKEGSYAMEKIILEKPDLILLDIEMPEMGGFEVLERIKENPATQRIPTIMLTGRSDTSTFEKAVDKKADRYISKPFKGKFLLEKVSQVLNEYERKYKE